MGKTEVLVTVFSITCKKRKLKLLIQEYVPQGNVKNSSPLCNALDASHQFKRRLSEIGEGWRGQLGMQRFGSVSHLWFTKTRDRCRFWRHAFAAGRRRKKSSVSPLAGMRDATASAQEHPGGREGEMLDPGEEYFSPFLRLPKVFLSLFGICRKSYNSALPACTYVAYCYQKF